FHLALVWGSRRIGRGLKGLISSEDLSPQSCSIL
ncbi:hypothetical protein Zm00014a_024398, partial [Zea mays]